MTTAVMGDTTVPIRGQEEHLVLKCIRRQRPPVAEDDRLSCSPIFVVDLRSIFCCDSTHKTLHPRCWDVLGSLSFCRTYSSGDRHGLAKPVFETRLAELCAIVGNECVLAKRCAVVAGLRVSNNLARIVA